MTSPVESSDWVDAKPLVVALPKRPDEEEKEEPKVEKSRGEEDVKASWGLDTTPLKKLIDKNRRRRSSFGGKTGAQIQEGCKLLREMCSPDKKRQQQQQQTQVPVYVCVEPEEEIPAEAPLLTPRSSNEDVQAVYGRFEILLNVLRVERHKEKLEAQKEIEELKNKIDRMEKAKKKKRRQSMGDGRPSRQSLGAITNIQTPAYHLSQPMDGKANDLKMDSIPEPSIQKYEEKILESVKQLMDKESQFEPEMDRKLLAWYFDEESNNKALEKERLELQQKVIEEHDFEGDEMPLRYFTALKEIQQYHDRVMEETAKNSVLTIKLEQMQEELTQAHQGTKGEQQQKEFAEKMMNPHMQELCDKMNEIQIELTGSKRNRSDLLMKLAVESTQKASLSMKLEAALSQIEKQKGTISLLNQELGKAKYECNMFLQKEREVLEEAKQMLEEPEEPEVWKVVDGKVLTMV